MFLIFILFLIPTVDIILWIFFKKVFPKITKTTIFKCLHFGSMAIFALYLLFSLLFNRQISSTNYLAVFGILWGVILAFYGMKTIVAFAYLVDLFIHRKSKNPHPFRLSFFSFFLGFGVFFLVVYSIFWGRYDFKIVEIDVEISNLPAEFENYKIAQISDIHTGSMALRLDFYQQVVDTINKLNADLIVFTGDLVNARAIEAVPTVEIFQKLSAPDGKLAVLGNHDYSKYSDWKTPADSLQNIKDGEDLLREMGFLLLKNEAFMLSRGDAQLAFIGTENWGRVKRQPREGRISDILPLLPADAPRILLSHDPSFWEDSVRGRSLGIDLTLSGHTHGMQLGVSLFGYKISPARFLFEHWGGLYGDAGELLYVNTGIGTVAYLGRIGMPPEITLFRLRKKS